mmetsp:Transcript_4849/g.12949  ORF Transcript_4849/g.12949 Transcript_4849/m.12949 type:complete len:239 (-) Transcript_4849:4592-5308(-)
MEKSNNTSQLDAIDAVVFVVIHAAEHGRRAESLGRDAHHLVHRSPSLRQRLVSPVDALHQELGAPDRLHHLPVLAHELDGRVHRIGDPLVLAVHVRDVLVDDVAVQRHRFVVPFLPNHHGDLPGLVRDARGFGESVFRPVRRRVASLNPAHALHHRVLVLVVEPGLERHGSHPPVPRRPLQLQPALDVPIAPRPHDVHRLPGVGDELDVKLARHELIPTRANLTGGADGFVKFFKRGG